jgi:uncharacterized protein YggE
MRVLQALALSLVATTAGATAQGIPYAGRTPAGDAGITVTGRGASAALPARARITVTLTVANAGGVTIDDAARALADALHANDVTDARVVLPVGNVNAAYAPIAVVGSVAKPTRERLETIAANVVKALPDRFQPILSKAQIQLALASDDCTPDEARAERAAFEDARSRAERLASIAGLHLGTVIALNAAQIFLPPGCPTKPDAIEPGGNAGVGFGNLYSTLTLPITVNLTLTYALR